MDTRFYQARGLDIERIAYDVEGIFFGQGYQVQHFGNKEQMVVQLRMGGDIEALIGMQAALTVTLQNGPNGVLATLGQQQWIDKAAAGTLGMLLLWPLAITAGIGVIRQASLEGQLFSTLDTAVMRQTADVHIGTMPPNMQGQPQQPGAPWPQQPQPQGTPWQSRSQPAPQQSAQPQTENIQCTNCQGMNEQGDMYCSHCGKPLTPPKKHCTACQANLKPDAAFCTKCGTSVPA